MSKNLKTSVKLDTGSAVKALDKLERKIKSVEKATNGINSQNHGLSKAINKVNRDQQRLVSSAKQHAKAVDEVNRNYKKTETTVGALTKKVRGLASAYLGVMGARAMINTADAITSAKNRLNYVNGGDGTTQESMDKMYASAQTARMGYTDMMGNVSKSMTLAPDAFDKNIDNAIRFQEIMAKAYTIGGASDAEMHSSMYQMIQALGSGILQGDELRSVREGAPIAYKEIEKFAQGVYKTEESLKDMASQGMITSEIVVAAMMNAGDGIDEAFAKTDKTFAQMWTSMKNTVVKVFEPMLQSMSKLANSKQMQKVMDGMTRVLIVLADALNYVWGLFAKFFKWFVDNWYWIQYIVYGVVVAIGIHLGILAAQAIKTAAIMFWNFITTLHPLYLIIMVIGIVVAAIVYLANTVKKASEFILLALFAIALGILAIGIITSSVTLMVVAAVIAGLALVLYGFMTCGAEILSFVYQCGAFIYNFVIGINNAILQLLWAACEPIISIVEFVLNACMGGFNSFGGAVANLIGQIISWFLSLGKVVTKIIDAIFGTDWTSGLQSLQDKVLGWGKNENAITINRDAPTIDRISYEDAGKLGAKHGTVVQNWLNDKVGAVQNAISGFNLGDQLDKFTSDNGKFVAAANGGLNPGDYGTLDPTKNGLGADDLGKKLGDIADDTDKISDAVALTNDDLDYLRKIAALEWKKEFTTANITVDMKNYNQVNGDNDLDGIVTTLTRKLYEELDAVAEGVYA